MQIYRTTRARRSGTHWLPASERFGANPLRSTRPLPAQVRTLYKTCIRQISFIKAHYHLTMPRHLVRDDIKSHFLKNKDLTHQRSILQVLEAGYNYVLKIRTPVSSAFKIYEHLLPSYNTTYNDMGRRHNSTVAGLAEHDKYSAFYIRDLAILSRMNATSRTNKSNVMAHLAAWTAPREALPDYVHADELARVVGSRLAGDTAAILSAVSPIDHEAPEGSNVPVSSAAAAAIMTALATGLTAAAHTKGALRPAETNHDVADRLARPELAELEGDLEGRAVNVSKLRSGVAGRLHIHSIPRPEWRDRVGADVVATTDADGVLRHIAGELAGAEYDPMNPTEGAPSTHARDITVAAATATTSAVSETPTAAHIDPFTNEPFAPRTVDAMVTALRDAAALPSAESTVARDRTAGSLPSPNPIYTLARSSAVATVLADPSHPLNRSLAEVVRDFAAADAAEEPFALPRSLLQHPLFTPEAVGEMVSGPLVRDADNGVVSDEAALLAMVRGMVDAEPLVAHLLNPLVAFLDGGVVEGTGIPVAQATAAAQRLWASHPDGNALRALRASLEGDESVDVTGLPTHLSRIATKAIARPAEAAALLAECEAAALRDINASIAASATKAAKAKAPAAGSQRAQAPARPSLADLRARTARFASAV